MSEIDLSPEKRMLLHMSDKEIRALLRMAHANMQATTVKKSPEQVIESGKWFDKKISGLPKDGMEHLREAKAQLRDPGSSHRVDRKWVRYAETYRNMKFGVPDFFRAEIRAKDLYQRLTDFCRTNDLPEEIVVDIVPELIHYIQTGHMRPILFVGEKGCGKTTAVRMLLKEGLQIPVETIKVPEADGSHGMTGDNGSYVSADVGCLAKAQLRNNSLIVGYVIDEIDKVPHSTSRANIADELLSITDESVDSIEDKYLETTLVGLPYCPIFFTGNDFSKINPILADRCKVVRYPKATAPRIKSIMTKYVQKKLAESTYCMIEFDYDLLSNSIDALLAHSISSLRKHQELVELVMNSAFTEAMTSECETVKVTAQMFTDAEKQIVGSELRRVGFGA